MEVKKDSQETDQERSLKGSSLFSRGEHQFLDLLHGPKAVVAHTRTSESSKGSFHFPEVYSLQRSSSLSERKVMN